MADQTDASPEEREDAAMACSTCGAAIDPTAWHAVATRVDDDGEFHLYAFCSDECRTEWERE